jgi:hypothetical protein
MMIRIVVLYQWYTLRKRKVRTKGAVIRGYMEGWGLWAGLGHVRG